MGMVDRDKVIEGLKELCEYLFHEYKVCYHGDEEETYNRFLSVNNALELLKEQESTVKFSKNYMDYVCSNCGVCINEEIDYMMDKPINFCPARGRKVKWDAAD